MAAHLMKLPDAAPLLDVSRERIYELAREGALPGIVRIGRRGLRIDRTALEKFIADGGARPECAA